MIVITSERFDRFCVAPTDRFCLTVSDSLGAKIIIDEEITVNRTIDFVASYRFALEDGTCPGFHLAGIFGNKAELPIEIVNAKRLSDLTPEQLENFTRTVGTREK